MMEEEQYCLKWNNHQSTLLTVLTGMMDSEKLADCVLSAEGRMIKSHQLVISACSPYLEKLLNDSRQPGLMPILVFSDLAFEELVALKEYMYKGEVNIRQNALDSFLKAAHSLQIKGLADGGGGDEGGGGGKRKVDPDSTPGPARRRRRRESRESDPNSLDDTQPTPDVQRQQVPARKQNVFSNSNFDSPPTPKVELEPVELPLPQTQIPQATQGVLKTEPHDQPETHDLTGADEDDYEGYELPGTSQPDLSQDTANWQMDNSMNSEDFAASTSIMAAQAQPGQSSQGFKSDPRKQRSDAQTRRTHNGRHSQVNKGPENSVSTRNGRMLKNRREIRKRWIQHMAKLKLSDHLKSQSEEFVSSTGVDSSRNSPDQCTFLLKPGVVNKINNIGNWKKFKPSSSLKTKSGKKFDGSRNVAEGGKTQPIEFIDVSKAGNGEYSGLDSNYEDPGILVTPDVDPLALETDVHVEAENTSAFPLFNFINRSERPHIIESSPPMDSTIHISDDDNYLDGFDDDRLSQDGDDDNDNLVIAEEEICTDCHLPLSPQHNCSTKQEDVDGIDDAKKKEALAEKKNLKSKTKRRSNSVDSNQKKSAKRRISQDSKKTTKAAAALLEEEKTFTCMICSLEFRKERELLIHGLYKHGETSPLDGIQCNQCDHTTSTIGSLYSHLNSVHLNQPKFKCHYCIYEASEPTVFHMHVINNHAKMINKSKLQVKPSVPSL